MNDCSAKSKLPAPLIYLSKTGNYRDISKRALEGMDDLFCSGRQLNVHSVELCLPIVLYFVMTLTPKGLDRLGGR
jgi:hypothetical protein